MLKQISKMSEIMKEMAESLLRSPRKVPSSEAAHVALMFANIAWNESVGMDLGRDGYRKTWEAIEAENPALWNELKANNSDALIDELVQFKKDHYPDDQRRILVCGFVKDKVHVEWLPPTAPGVDSQWEMRLYGLVRTGQPEKAIRFLQKTRRMSRTAAATRVKAIAVELGAK